MKKPIQKFYSEEDAFFVKRDQLDLKRVMAKLLDIWPFVTISVVLALSIAFLINRYSKSTYSIEASIIIRTKEEIGSGAELVYENVLVSRYRNYLNEPYKIRAFPLVKKTLEDLCFNSAFFVEGRVVTTESYNKLPFKVTFLQYSEKSLNRYYLQVVDENHFSLRFTENENSDSSVFRFGEMVDFDSSKFKIDLRKDSLPTLKANDTYLLEFSSSDNLAQDYISRMEFKWAEKGSTYMNIYMTGNSPEKDKEFLLRLLKNYEREDLSQKNQVATKTVEFVRSQLHAISDSLRLYEVQLARFKNSNNTLGELEFENERILVKLDESEKERMELVIRKEYFKYLGKYLKEDRDLDQVIMPSVFGIDDPNLNSILTKMIELQQEIRLFMSTEKTARNPLLTNKLTRLKGIKSDVSEAVRTLQASDALKSKVIDDKTKKILSEIRAMPSVQSQYVSIQRNFRLMEQLFIFLMNKKSEAEISKAANISDLIIVNPPTSGSVPISPNKKRNYMLALVIGLMIPVAWVVVAQSLSTLVQNKQDIERLTDVPIIGGIGHVRKPLKLEVLNNPQSVVSESFRSLRANISFFVGNTTPVVVVVTSSLPGEGKSFTSINLASVLSLSGKRTLIIGADLRKPTLHLEFGLHNKVGLSSYLAGLCELPDIVQPSGYENLDFVPTGVIPPNPSELILNERMEELIKKAKEMYDFIVIDTPPLGLISDAYQLSKFANHIVFIVRQNYTPRQMVTMVQEYYSSKKLRNLSILLNDIEVGAGYIFGDQYSYSYRHISKYYQ